MKKTKSILLTGLVCLMSGALAAGFAACRNENNSTNNGNSSSTNSETSSDIGGGNNSSGSHEHFYVEQVIAPTCMEEGYTTYT